MTRTSIIQFLKSHKVKLIILAGFFMYWLFSLPSPLFEDPHATVVESAEGELLGARIAGDGQWRFPALDSVPVKFEKCILLFEDEYFYTHPGFNPVAMGKAIWGNITTDKRRGGSTITQQVIRLSRKGTERSYMEKLVELIKATRLEAGYAKEEILNMYATYAPFGGNVVGLETAAWRYFGLPADRLSWGQMAALAVLPNNPSMVRPGKNEVTLSRKRNELLKKLWKTGEIDETTYELSLLEKLPGKPYPLPQLAPHLVERVKQESEGKRIQTTIKAPLQRSLNRLAKEHYGQLKQNEIYNLAMVVIDVNTKEVVGYVGNAPTDAAHQKDVDIVTKSRSTGSTLKPFLYAGMLDEGMLLPKTLVADIPTSINNYQPQNFNNEYSGAVAADVALARSLNVPAVRLLRQYGLDKFYGNLKEMNLGGINKPASHYGLAMILGGAESSLFELTKTYAGMANTLHTFNNSSSEYSASSFEEYTLRKRCATCDKNEESLHSEPSVFSAGAIYNTLETLRTVNRPNGEENWQFYEDAQPIAWKTGTSFGFKDAWAVGVTPQYAIGVWVGNADGEGRPGITGIQAAAPLFFDILRSLPMSGNWFDTPYDALAEINVCTKSGMKASVYCPLTESILAPVAGEHSAACPYHKQVYVDHSETYRVNSDCYELDKMKAKNYFALPASLAFYYSGKHPDYKELPPYLPDCGFSGEQPMVFIYPKNNEGVILPKNFDSDINDVVLKVAHRNPETKLFWYLDNNFIGSTEVFHELAIAPEVGIYVLTVVDAQGNELKKQIEVSRG
ncbi:penicillin-binding protein 1C [Dokdonia sp. Hel_I_63]|uniref:penicillin-binding protein 1C n=1 Tax=Dokdonia sp. Hel_I_63 TaxID=1249996 RepID=UPI0011A6034A|nr:penicillin-binding protein 1C [Dokdonia sp. Hel_I_63]